MRITATSADALPSHPVAWGVPVATGDDGPRYAVPLDGFDLGLPARLDPAWCKRRDFGGKVGQTLTLRSAAPAPAAPTEGGASAPAGPVSTTEIVPVGRFPHGGQPRAARGPGTCRGVAFRCRRRRWGCHPWCPDRRVGEPGQGPGQ